VSSFKLDPNLPLKLVWAMDEEMIPES
jgi:hypothetical protein